MDAERSNLLSRRGAMAGLGLLGLAPWRGARAEASYTSPYRLAYQNSIAALDAGFDTAPWNNPHDQARVPYRSWYTRSRHPSPWGPAARQYPSAPAEGKDRTWLQERVIRAASLHIGLLYQHHHIPAWDPPAGWPWLHVAAGHNSPGLDCSNFSSFNYNYGLGIKLPTGITRQASQTELPGPGGRGRIRAQVLAPKGYDAIVAALEPADLLYIRNKQGKIAHVIMWLGRVGVDPNGTPLIIDSTGSGHKDSNGQPIPIGVYIRPFNRNGWYANDFAHAHRLVDAVQRVEPGAAPEFPEGGDEGLEKGSDP